MLLLGCYTATNVYTNQSKDTDMAQYQSYAWLPSQDTASSALYDNEILQRNLMGEIDEQLMARGYAQENQKPDMLVLMHLMFEHDTVLERYPVYSSYDYFYPRAYVISGYGYYYSAYNRFNRVEGFEIDTVAYTEGTVVIDIIDAKTNKLVWRGWSERLITAENYKSGLSKDIKAILREFPIKPNRREYSTGDKQLKELQFYELVGAW